MHTTEKLTFTDDILPICLPAEENLPVAGDICINTGWGELGNIKKNQYLAPLLVQSF